MADYVTETEPSVTGYTVDNATKSLTLAATGNVINFYYTPNPCTVIYDPGDHGNWTAGNKTYNVVYDTTPLPGRSVQERIRRLGICRMD